MLASLALRESIMPLSEQGDDDDDLEGDFETCNDAKLWPALKKKYVGDAITGGRGDKLPILIPQWNTLRSQHPQIPYLWTISRIARGITWKHLQKRIKF